MTTPGPIRTTLFAVLSAVLGTGCDTVLGTLRGSDPVGPALAATATAPSASPPQPEKLDPAVALDGTFHAPSVGPPRSGGRRVYSRALRTWVYEQPSLGSERLGYLRAGASSPTSARPAGTDGCPRGWQPVWPKGFVCLGRSATLDARDPIVVAAERHPPDASRKLPYIYGTVRRPGPIYGRLPSREELSRTEPGIESRMRRWLDEDGENGAGFAPEVWLASGQRPADARKAWESSLDLDVPAALAKGGVVANILGKPREDRQLVLGTAQQRVGYSFLETFIWEGRRYGLTSEQELLPADRLRPIRGSDYHGVLVGKEAHLPFAIVRHPGARFWAYRSRSDTLVDLGKAPYRQVVQLTGKQSFFQGNLYYETSDDQWLSDREASRVRPAKRMPAWATKGERWIDINLSKQLLLLYEGTQLVYATLVSSGEAGLDDPEHTTATKRGIFRIHTKHIAATMSSLEIGEEFELRDVPYVQYFEEGYALHGAYWHDRFGLPKSHGCINLAPEDARRLFYWTEPQVPPGWHGALLPLRGTVVFIHI